MADRPEQLTYVFSDDKRNSGAHAHTFSVTITKEAIATAGRVILCYNLTHHPEHENNVPPNSPGVMRTSYTEETKRGILRHAGRNIRYELAYLDASSYETNPRNLEAFWKPVYRAVLLDVIDGMDMCDVLEESPIWIFDDARDRMPLDATVSMPQGGGKTVFPDVSVVMRKGTLVRNHKLLVSRFLPVLVELKRAISRSLTVDGYPDPTKPHATKELSSSFRVGQRQIELAAYLHFLKTLDQDGAVLIVGVGPLFRTLTVTREEVLSVLGATFGTSESPEADCVHYINDLEGFDELTRESDEGPIVDEPSTVADPGFAAHGNLFDGLSYLPRWSTPTKLKSDESEKLLGDVQDFVRRML